MGDAVTPRTGSNAAPAQLAQSMASFAAAGSALDGVPQSDPAVMGTAAASPLVAPIGQIHQT